MVRFAKRERPQPAVSLAANNLGRNDVPNGRHHGSLLNAFRPTVKPECVLTGTRGVKDPERFLNAGLSIGSKPAGYGRDILSLSRWMSIMLNRLFALAFVLAILGLPFVALIGMAGGVSSASGAFSPQKGLCYATGIGCGSGHSVLPALSLIKA